MVVGIVPSHGFWAGVVANSASEVMNMENQSGEDTQQAVIDTSQP